MLPQTIVCQTSQSFSQFPAVKFIFLVNFKAQSVVWCFSINFAPKYNKDNCFRFLPNVGQWWSVSSKSDPCFGINWGSPNGNSALVQKRRNYKLQAGSGTDYLWC